MNERDWTLYQLTAVVTPTITKSVKFIEGNVRFSMTKIRFLDIVISAMILSKMQRISFLSRNVRYDVQVRV